MTQKSPGVHFPPPVLYVIGFSLGIVLNNVWPLSLFPNGRPTLLLVFGWLLLSLGWIVVTIALLLFFRHRTGIYPNQPARLIIENGPYRYSRNPMYVALTMMYLGLSCISNVLWPLLLLPIVLIILQVAVIKREEVYLQEAFGEKYTNYCQRVRRWL